MKLDVIVMGHCPHMVQSQSCVEMVFVASEITVYVDASYKSLLNKMSDADHCRW